MSTRPVRLITRQFLLAVSVIAAAASLASSAFAQQSRIEIRLLPDSNRIAIELATAPASAWSFVDSYAGIVGLGRRIERFAAFDGDGNEVSLSQTAPGQFRSAKPARRLRYEVDLKPSSRAAELSHISWLDKERGVLMASDLLPVESGPSGSNGKDLRIHFQLPKMWTVVSGEVKLSEDDFTIEDLSRAVFAVGTSLRVSQTNASGLTLNFVSDGQWAFADSDVVQLAQQVLKAHRKTFGSFPSKTVTFILFSFPLAASATQWSAETRGTTVTLLMGKLPSKVAALAQLSTPMTHEFFHLWVPNALALEGDYDWFYEGFTIYQAAQTAVKLGLLTFPEFLNSMARAYDSSKIDSSSSLVEASKRRFTGGLTSVYAKGQVVAFIYDLRLRSLSRNKRSLVDVYRKMMNAAKTDSARRKTLDGNEVATSLLSEEMGADDFVRRFIQNPVSINLAAELAPFALKIANSGLRTEISVEEKLSKQHRDLLRELGYNAATHATR